MSKGVTGSGTAEFFYRPDAERTIVFHHLPKTAGSSVRAAIRDTIEARVVTLQPPPLKTPQSRLAQWYADYLDGSERSSLALAMTHSGGHLLSILGEEAEGATIVREPVDRVLSRYYFSMRRRDPAHAAAARAEVAAQHKLWMPPQPLSELYEAGTGDSEASSGDHYHLRHYFNGQARLLLEPWYDTTPLLFSTEPPPDADLWREWLFDDVLRRYTVGVYEHLAPLTDVLSRRLSLGTLDLPRYKANPLRPPTEETPESLREAIAAHNWLDRELYEWALSDVAALEADRE